MITTLQGIPLHDVKVNYGPDGEVVFVEGALSEQGERRGYMPHMIRSDFPLRRKTDLNDKHLDDEGQP